MKTSIITILICLGLLSCSDNTTEEIPAKNIENQKTSKISLKSKPKYIANKKMSQIALAADMKTVEEFLNKWSSASDSDNKQYSENTYRMLMLARSLLTNTHMLPEYKIKIIDKYNRKQLHINNLAINVRTNEQRINRILRDILYFPYPTRGALYLVYQDIANNEEADLLTKAQAYTRMAQINDRFYRYEDVAQSYLKEFEIYRELIDEDKIKTTLDRISNIQKSIVDEKARAILIEKVLNTSGTTYAHTKLRLSLCEAYTRCERFDDARDELDKLYNQVPDAYNNKQLKKLEKIILEKKPIPREKVSWIYSGDDISEIPGVRIDWREFWGRDSVSYRQYFGTLLDELINKEQGK